MSKYVHISGTSTVKPMSSLQFAQNDINYNLRLAKKKRDRDMYIRMMKLRGHVNFGIRMADKIGDVPITLRTEVWKNGKKYVVRTINGKFRAVIDA